MRKDVVTRIKQDEVHDKCPNLDKEVNVEILGRVASSTSAVRDDPETVREKILNVVNDMAAKVETLQRFHEDVVLELFSTYG